MVDSTPKRQTTTLMIIIAIVAALGLLSVVGVTIVPIQQAEAKGCPQPTFGNPTAPGYTNSGGKCFTIPNS